MNDDQFNTLLSAIANLQEASNRHDEQFVSIQENLGSHDQQLANMQETETRHEQQFENMFFAMNDMNKRLDTIESKVDAKADRELILEQFDAIRGFVEDEQVETAAFTAKVDRHEVWINKASPILGVDFTTA